jgi:hypothetical protein
MSIYKITGANLCYIGSTTQKINKRFSKHKYQYKEWKKGNGTYCSSYKIFDAAGIENCMIELVEETKTLLSRERFYIETMPCVNILIPTRVRKERPEYQNKKIRTVCECGGSYTRSHKAHHYKSKKHLNLCPPPQSQNTNQNSFETSFLPDSPNQSEETRSFP